MAYRFDAITVTDPEAGSLELRGDGFAAAGETLSLLESAGVQHYLGMTADEIARAAGIAARYRDALKRVYSGRDWQPPHLDPATSQARNDLAVSVEGLLGAQRARRLQRLSWRIRGADALVDDRVGTALALTEKQRADIDAQARTNEAEQSKVLTELRAVRLRGREGLVDRGTEVEQAGRKRLLALLSAEQRQAFQRLLREED